MIASTSLDRYSADYAACVAQRVGRQLNHLALKQHDVDERVLVHRRQYVLDRIGSQGKPGSNSSV